MLYFVQLSIVCLCYDILNGSLFIFVFHCRDVVSGIVHLHELGIIHRDLKPQNVLIKKDKTLCAKLSDMGISKRLLADMSSLGHHATGRCSYIYIPSA